MNLSNGSKNTYLLYIRDVNKCRDIYFDPSPSIELEIKQLIMISVTTNREHKKMLVLKVC
jgi:hypothetical protein